MRRIAVVGILCVAACGGGGSKKPTKPKSVSKPTKPKPKPETEADREAKRLTAAHDIVPEGTNCIPTSLHPAELTPTLELGTIDRKPVLCAIDADEGRLLGPVACWDVDTKSGALTYRAPEVIPGRGFPVRLDGKCARGYCLPAEPAAPIVHIAWSHGGDKVAVAIPGSDPEIHIFGAEDKAEQSVIRPKDEANGDKALPTDLAGIMFVGDVIGAIGVPTDDGSQAVYLFKADGTPVGAVERFGGKAKGPVSIKNGSVSVFGDGMLALSEDALTTVTTIDVKTGARGKLVRKPPKTKCKQKDLDALLAGSGDKASDKCKKDYAHVFEPLIGAPMVQGTNNHLILLRGERYGELAVVDAKTLVENRKLAAAWCDDAKPSGDNKAPDDGTDSGGDDAAPDE